MKKYLVLLCLIFFAKLSFSQSTIGRCINRGSYDYIPVSYLANDSIEGIFSNFKLFENENKTTFRISWNSFCSGGKLYLIITPEQIYHIWGWENENINQGFLHWVLDIDSLVYQQIIEGFQKEKIQYGYFDSSYSEANFLHKNENGDVYWNMPDCDISTEKQIDKLFFQLNRFITNKKLKLDKAKRIITPSIPISFYNQ